jgi:hypothetical protein
MTRRIIRDCLFSIICYAWSLVPDVGDVRYRQLGETSFVTNIEYLTFPCFSAHTPLVIELQIDTLYLSRRIRRYGLVFRIPMYQVPIANIFVLLLHASHNRD